METATVNKTPTVIHERAESMPELGQHNRQRLIAWLFGGTAIALFFLMAIGGVLMRLNQAEIIDIGAIAFYRIMTLHGAGMIVAALLGTSGGLWYAVREILPLDVNRMLANWILTVVGALVVLVSTLVGGFATGWTFLYPLPFMSAGQWGDPAAIGYLLGLALVAIGFLVFCIDLVTKTVQHYGSLSRSIGWAFLRGRDDSPPPPPVLAAFTIGIQGIVTTTMAFPVVFAQLTKAIESGTYINALWAKELTYQYGHTLANLTIYLAAGMIYTLLPRYVGRPWKTTKPIAIGWLATVVIVLTAFFHHLYMDFAQPEWASMIGMVASSAAAIPVAVVTMYTGLMLVWGSSFRWTLASTLIFMGFFGWATGGVGAVMDSLIPVNFRMHNTLWVPAHFHSYMLMGVILWTLALVTHLFERAANTPSSRFTNIAAPSLIFGGGTFFVGVWYFSGASGGPRRYAQHFSSLTTADTIASIAALVLLSGVVLIFLEWIRLGRIAAASRGPKADRPAASLPSRPVQEAKTVENSPMIQTRGELIAVIAALTFSLVPFLPMMDPIVAEKVQWHHIQHGGQLLFGLLLAIAFVNTPTFSKLRCSSETIGILGVILGSAVLFVMMIPTVYGTLENDQTLHVLYHLAVVVVGIVVGWSLTAFDRFTAWMLFLMMAAMGFAYGAGVGIMPPT
jgi:cytochrome c oxidase subunit 1